MTFESIKSHKKHELELHGKTYKLFIGENKFCDYVKTDYNLPYIDKKTSHLLIRKNSKGTVQCPSCDHLVLCVMDLHYHMKKLHKAQKTSIEKIDMHTPPNHPPHGSFHSTQALSVGSQEVPAVPHVNFNNAKAGPSKFKSAFKFTPSQVSA